jgi:Ni,Fe-hydrogenase maturation factor
LRVVVGGIGELYQGDLDAGRLAAERLASQPLGDAVIVEDFSYGAVAVVQRLLELAPDALVLVAAVERGRDPGVVERRAVPRRRVDPALARNAVADAVTGYVTLELLLEVGAALEALPLKTVAIEIEPELRGPSELISATAERAIAHAVELVLAELRALEVLE